MEKTIPKQLLQGALRPLGDTDIAHVFGQIIICKWSQLEIPRSNQEDPVEVLAVSRWVTPSGVHGARLALSLPMSSIIYHSVFARLSCCQETGLALCLLRPSTSLSGLSVPGCGQAEITARMMISDNRCHILVHQGLSGPHPQTAFVTQAWLYPL